MLGRGSAVCSVAIVVIIIADVDPLPAITGPCLAPAPAIGGIVVIVRPAPAHGKGRTKESKVAETVVPSEEAVPEREVVNLLPAKR